jgi:hypothetical protein
MRSILPYILIFLGLFTAVCIAYIAWELSSEPRERKPADRDDAGGDAAG